MTSRRKLMQSLALTAITPALTEAAGAGSRCELMSSL